MSRTKRRKSLKTPEDYAFHEYVVRYYNVSRWESYADKWDTIVDKSSKQYKRFCENIFRKDTRVGYGWNGNVPKYYRKILTESHRAKDKAVVRKILKSGNYEDYNFNPWKSDAGYDYW